MNGSAVDLGIVGPAMLAGLLVLATHVPLGMQVLDRGIVFIDLAIAQIAALGVIAAGAMGLETGGLTVQVAAISAALGGAALLTWTERRAGAQQEALIGVLFVLAASGGLLLLASNPHGSEQMKDLLAGQILWVGKPQLLALAAVTALLLVAIASGATRRLGRFGFYATFAVAVTASVQVVGIYLVFTSLIVPALATLRWQGRMRLVVAYGVGVIGYGCGLALSAVFDLPSGPAVVWMLGVAGLGIAVVGKRLPCGQHPAHA